MEVTNINGHIRFCAWEAYNGARRHYLCSHREYCCALGCCVSTAFSLYQLWYFWLLLLLIILLCSGGGWWFRFRHGGFNSTHSPTNSRGRRHGRRARGHGVGGPRVYPNQQQFYEHSLPPGYDKDPPSYNEVISHLNQFPRIEDVRRTQGDASTSGSDARPDQVPLDLLDHQLGPPPPPYEMVLDLKRRDLQLTREIQDLEEEEEDEEARVGAAAGEEAGENTTSSHSRIRNLLGRIRPRRSVLSDITQTHQPAGSAHSSASTSSSASSSSASSSSSPTSPSSGLFTISRESLPMQDYYAQGPVPSGAGVQPQDGALRQYPGGQPLDTDSSSHSDYSSLLVSSLSSSRRSLVITPPHPTMELVATAPLEGEMISPEPQERLRSAEAVGCERPCTGRSVLSRPTTSISTHTLPAPEDLCRKTSLPGALVEQEDDRVEVS